MFGNTFVPGREWRCGGTERGLSRSGAGSVGSCADLRSDTLWKSHLKGMIIYFFLFEKLLSEIELTSEGELGLDLLAGRVFRGGRGRLGKLHPPLRLELLGQGRGDAVAARLFVLVGVALLESTAELVKGVALGHC